MFYKTNAHLLEMLKNLKFIPSDKNTLEVIINSTKTAGTFNRLECIENGLIKYIVLT